MKSRNALIARLGLSALLSSGLLLTPALAWAADDGGADAADDVAADVAPSTGTAGTSGGGAGTAVVIPEDDAGCSTVGGANDTPTGVFAFLGAAAAVFGVGYWRRRRVGR